MAVAAALLHLGWILLIRTQGPVRPSAQPSHSRAEDSYYRGFLENDGSAVRILQFYANTREVIEGEPAVVCYGVQNAQSTYTESRKDGSVDYYYIIAEQYFE